MSQSIQLSDEVIQIAQGAAQVANRTVDAQIEHWAQLGRAIESLVEAPSGSGQLVSECLATVDSEAGRQRVRAYLDSLPFPHYEPAGDPGVLVRIDADGTRTTGRFVGREFRAVR